MTLYGAGLVFTFLFLGFLYAAVGARAWRGESALDGDSPPHWWFFGDAAWRGVARAFVAMGPFLALALIGAMIAEFGGGEDLGMGLAAAGLLGALLVQLPIILFNRPRALVPPHLRSEPGALEERRARRRPAR